MDNNKIKVSVVVAGQRFTILTDKSEKYVRDIASEIDARINSLVLTSNMTRERAAVLTAMDYADDSVLDRENIAAVKEQIKDYVQEIERLQDNNAKLVSDYNLLKAEYERLIEERQTAQDFEEKAKKALDDSQEQIASLKEQLKKANEQIESLKNQQSADDEIPLPEEAPAEQEKPITAEDDLFFDVEEEEVIKPEKKKKNRHEHHHVNPYQQKAKDKEQKGYTQQRQYSFFELDE
ncbi:cell division protein ZapA [uncultured Ruminococcus sp.]|uniref:cell division protein ZapA n=1 Tax=uncultured Ruminococcus sp. TaxID=165186 RepID=UPI00292D7937|nr:cell division protein ZapA [uncultured Ruminococcus sp.]